MQSRKDVAAVQWPEATRWLHTDLLQALAQFLLTRSARDLGAMVSS